MNEPGMLSLTDIHPHWHYDRFSQGPVPHEQRRILLNPNPSDVRSKGRPKGAKPLKRKHAKDNGETSTRRDPSMHEHEAIIVPSSSAPARLDSMPPPPKRTRLSTLPIDETASQIAPQTPSTPTTTIDLTEKGMRSGRRKTTTSMALDRGAGGEEDQYQPGTLRERAYLRSIPPGKLSTADVGELDSEDEDEDNVDEIEEYEDGKYAWELYDKKAK